GFKRVVVDKSHYHSLTFEKGEWKAQAYDIASFSNYRQTVSDGGRTFASCSNFAYSPLASFRMGMSASASFQRVRKSLYAASARTRAASASAPCEVLACKALARATPKMRQRSRPAVPDDAAVVDDPLELGRGGTALSGCQVCLPA